MAEDPEAAHRNKAYDGHAQLKSQDGEIDPMFRLTIVLIIAATCRAQSTNPLAADPQAAETGRWTFRILCAPCHGIHADGGRGPDLTRGAWSVGDQDKDLYSAIAA